VTLNVRRAVPEDAASIAAVHVATWRAAYRGLVPDAILDGLSLDQREQQWRDELTGESSPAVYVAAEDGAVVGFCAVAAPSRDEDASEGVAEIGAIYVRADSWRRGVGRSLMDAALTDLRAGGWRSVTLWVLAENRRARDFYARLGFEPDGAEMAEAQSGLNEVRLRSPVRA
jgi:ribosomal protein S18 acetylase RimI-like enzyme